VPCLYNGTCVLVPSIQTDTASAPDPCNFRRQQFRIVLLAASFEIPLLVHYIHSNND
jgi:hypothetical protein